MCEDFKKTWFFVLFSKFSGFCLKLDQKILKYIFCQLFYLLTKLGVFCLISVNICHKIFYNTFFFVYQSDLIKGGVDIAVEPAPGNSRLTIHHQNQATLNLLVALTALSVSSCGFHHQ